TTGPGTSAGNYWRTWADRPCRRRWPGKTNGPLMSTDPSLPPTEGWDRPAELSPAPGEQAEEELASLAAACDQALGAGPDLPAPPAPPPWPARGGCGPGWPGAWTACGCCAATGPTPPPRRRTLPRCDGWAGSRCAGSWAAAASASSSWPATPAWAARWR